MRLERFRFRAMGSPCEFKLWAESRNAAAAVANACGQEIDRLERKFSRYRDDSLATRINRSAGDPAGVEVDSETAALLDFAATAHRESDGRFDPTSGVLRRVWNFKSGRVPTFDAVQEVLALVGWSKLHWKNSRIVLPTPGMELDFGGFVKEYAADRATELCRCLGLTAGIIDLGGDLAVVGPHPDGQPWLVGIRNPRRPSEALARIALRSGGLATSGDYERFMIANGKRYSHLLDPRTGQPHDGGPACVSITAEHCLTAGITSTIAMLQPESDAPQFLQNVGLPHLLVTQSGKISGTADHIDMTGGGGGVREAPLDGPSRPINTFKTA
jgi:thiamine biosynthesis lipoprotein